MRVYLRICSTELSADAITGVLGLTPTEVSKPRTGGHAWVYEPSGESASFDDALAVLLQWLVPLEAQLVALSKHCTLTLEVTNTGKDSALGMSLSADHVRQIARLALEVDFDLYPEAATAAHLDEHGLDVYERVLVRGSEDAPSSPQEGIVYWKYRQADGSWIYTVYFTAQGVYRDVQDRARERRLVFGTGEWVDRTHFIGTRDELSVDAEFSVHSDLVDGCYRLNGKDWAVFTAFAPDAEQPQGGFEFRSLKDGTQHLWVWLAAGEAFAEETLKRALCAALNVSSWDLTSGPNSMALRPN